MATVAELARLGLQLTILLAYQKEEVSLGSSMFYKVRRKRKVRLEGEKKGFVLI